MGARMRVAFFGSGAFGMPTLAMLHERTELVGIVTQPARPAGRGSQLAATPVAAWAAENAPDVAVFTPENVNAPEAIERIRGWRAQTWVVVAYGQKLGPALLDGVFAINLHASRLPRWRGASPINAAILAGDVETGNSVITLAQRMDAGLILAQSRVTIDPAWTAGDLEAILAADGPGLVWRVLEAHQRGDVMGEPQDPALVTRAPKLSKADAWVDFEQPAKACRRRIHGLNPWPGVTASVAGLPVKLLRAEVMQGGKTVPEELKAGCLVDPMEGVVQCGGETRLRILQVHPAGGRQMTWAEFARGRKLSRGDVVGSR